MSTGDSFRALLVKVRAGDETAAAELVRQYEPAIRRFIRLRLTNTRTRRVFDSADLCQSVLANFFVRVRVGQFDLADSKQLMKLLTAMAQNKVRDVARKLRAARRDDRRVQTERPEAVEEAVDAQAAPSSIVAAREMLQQVRRRLSEDERYLADQRGIGRDWADIAKELQSRPDALRIKLSRALNRVAGELGLVEVKDE